MYTGFLLKILLQLLCSPLSLILGVEIDISNGLSLVLSWTLGMLTAA